MNQLKPDILILEWALEANRIVVSSDLVVSFSMILLKLPHPPILTVDVVHCNYLPLPYLDYNVLEGKDCLVFVIFLGSVTVH